MINDKQPLKIGNLTFEKPFFLAPLAGISDKSMRSLCMQQGASLTFTEMVSAKGLWYGDRKSRKLLELAPEETSVGYQLFGREPEILAHAVDELNDCDNKVFDLNCGCPVPKVVKNGEGSALLREPDVLGDVVAAMVKKSVKPVTVKIRMGFYKDTMIAEEIAKVAQAAGADAITVHGRTREQYYEGKADWSAIAAVKKAVTIPVIGNGDIMSGSDAIDMMNMTGADGAMIARGALGNPWIFKECVTLWDQGILCEKPTRNERIDMLLHHYDLIEADKGERIAVREVRKHIGWYIKGMHGAAAVKRRSNTISSGQQLREIMSELYAK